MYVMTWCNEQKVKCEHVVPLIGFSVTLPTVAILMKFCDGGDLQKLLRQQSTKFKKPVVMPHPPRIEEHSTNFLEQSLLSHNSLSSSLELEMVQELRTTEFNDLTYRINLGLEVARGIQMLHAASVVHVSDI